MSEEGLGRLEQWTWRLLMPALLFGGVAAAWVLLTVAVLRGLGWRRFRRDDPWSLPGGSWPWILYYALQVIAGLWSANTGAWAFSLEVKVSMVFFPAVAGIPGVSIRKEFWWSVGWSIVLFLAWRLIFAGWHQVMFGDGRHWRYAGFAGGVHPTYLSLHATVAWLGLSSTWGRVRWSFALTILLAVSIGLMGSKAGILIALGVAMAEPLLHRLWRCPEARRRSAMVPIAFIVLLGLSAGLSAGARFKEMGSAAAVIQSEGAPVTSSSAGRIAVWRSSADLLFQHPLGVGTGDVTDELLRIYERDGVSYATVRKLNPHNQWLQAGVAFGWFGVIVFSLILWFWLNRSWRLRDGIGVLCGCVFLVHSSVESVLEVQRGVVFILWMWVAIQEADGWGMEDE